VDVLLLVVVAVLVSGALVGLTRVLGRAHRRGPRGPRVRLAGLLGAVVGLLGASLLVGLWASLYWLGHVVRVFL
jgi:membrane associated rhomboid family serine protease